MNFLRLNDLVRTSETSGPYKPTIPEEQNYGYPTGWICPKCGKVYGPNERECPYCNGRFTITCMYF